MKTDLNILHKAGDIIQIYGTRRRRVGKTMYFCHCVAAHLELLENDVIVVVVEKLDRVEHFISVLEPVLKEHGIQIRFVDKSCWRITFWNNTNQVKFMTPSTMNKMHPIDSGASYNQYPILDLDYINPSYYMDHITIGDIAKYTQHIFTESDRLWYEKYEYDL